MTVLLRFLLVATLLFAAPVLAVQPDEVLDDPVLEERARALSRDIRCLVCRNESIDESTADLARDLRILVRERLVLGDSDAQVKDFLVARFGEYVLLRPPFTAGNAALWLSAPLMLLLGGGVAFAFVRRRSAGRAAPRAQANPLSPEEEARIATLMAGGSGTPAKPPTRPKDGTPTET